MRLFKLSFLAATLCALAVPTQAQDEQINILCSVQVDWCNLIQTTFSRVGGVKVNIVQRSTGEALAQINAERANPKTDVWFGGTGDPHLQAAEPLPPYIATAPAPLDPSAYQVLV